MNGLDFGFGPLELEFWRWMFVMTRIGAALLAAPIFGASGVPMQVRVVVTGAIAALVCSWTDVTPPHALLSANGILWVAGEALIGLTLGFVLQLSFAAPMMAAELIGGGMGMSMAAASDPNTGAHSTALGQYFTVVLTLIFLSLGGHLQWLDLVVESYKTFPPGETWLGTERIGVIVGFGSQMFLTAVAIALPVTLVLLIVQLVAGVLSRSAPALNLFSLGLPAGVLAGLAALIISAPMLADQFADLTTQAIRQTGEVIAK
ncbi:MAG: flagellar biosynthetic protein FliR [Novosphingobium sp.]